MMTMNELQAEWQQMKRAEVKPGTAAAYEAMWCGVKHLIGDMEVSGFGVREARGLLGDLLAEGLAAKTIRERIALVRRLLRWAATELGVAVRPLSWGLRLPVPEPRRLQRYTEAEALRLVRWIVDKERDTPRRSVGVLVSLLTGLRIGEVAGLRWEDIDWRHGVLTVRRTVGRVWDSGLREERVVIGAPKTRAGFRDVPMVPVLRKVLRRLKGEPGEYVASGTEQPISPRCLRDKLERVQRRARVPEINFHGLRHTFASLLVESGGDVKTISVVLGHSDVTTTLNLYVHPSDKAKRDVVMRAWRKI